MTSRLDALKARVAVWRVSDPISRVHIPVTITDIERLVAVLQLLADYSPLNILPWEQQRRDALAYWLEEAE